MMFFQKKVDLPGSERTLPPRCERTGDVDGSSLISVTVVLRRTGSEPIVDAQGMIQQVRREDFCQKFCADPKDVQAVEQFAHHHHLSVVETSLAKRRVVLRGTVKSLSAAFGATLAQYRNTATNDTFRGRSGTLSIPAELQNVVIAVLGLDNRQAAFAHFRVLANPAAAAATFTAVDIAKLYNFPQGLD
jgi:kumamolisin